MFFKEWEVLLVDDEPDVLSISKLAMKNLEVYGLPVKIHTATSKAEAIEFLNNRVEPIWSGLSIAFIDVVMETDSAGLELCQHIREEMGNRTLQLFIRTGQPGLAPEREVIDRYDINGYFSKLETTEDKLYSLVKSGIRQFLWSRMSLISLTALDMMIAAAGSRNDIFQRLQALSANLNRYHVDDGNATPDIPRYGVVGGTLIENIGLDEEEALVLLKRLDNFEGIALSATGDKYVRDENNYQLMKVVAQDSKVEAYYLYQTSFVPPDYAIAMFYQFLSGMATLWYQAR